MSAKRKVLAMRPEARAEHHRDNGGQRYYLIRMGREYMWFAEGDTEAKAWKAALERLEEKGSR